MLALELIKIEDKDLILTLIIYIIKKVDISLFKHILIPKKQIFYLLDNCKKEWIKQKLTVWQ